MRDVNGDMDRWRDYIPMLGLQCSDGMKMDRGMNR